MANRPFRAVHNKEIVEIYPSYLPSLRYYPKWMKNCTTAMHNFYMAEYNRPQTDDSMLITGIPVRQLIFGSGWSRKSYLPTKCRRFMCTISFHRRRW